MTLKISSIMYFYFTKKQHNATHSPCPCPHVPLQNHHLLLSPCHVTGTPRNSRRQCEGHHCWSPIGRKYIAKTRGVDWFCPQGFLGFFFFFFCVFVIERVVVSNDARGSWVFNVIIWKRIERKNGELVEVSIWETKWI